MRILIAGCGYVGFALGTELAKQGHEVFGLRRSSAAAAKLGSAGIQSLTGDITRPEELAQLPAQYDWVVNCVASSRGGGIESYRKVYLQGMSNLIAWLAGAPPLRFVYTSSTSVYGQIDGSTVTEASPAESSAETAKVLIETERVLIDAVHYKNFPASIVRVAGIYGPGRSHLLRQVLNNEATIVGAGERIMNMIHLEDAVGAIMATLERGHAGEIYNAVDDEPVSQMDFYQWLSGVLVKELPPVVSEVLEASRKRNLANRRVSNRRLKADLCYRLKYPTFRQGYTAEIRQAVLAGDLVLDPESRLAMELPRS